MNNTSIAQITSWFVAALISTLLVAENSGELAEKIVAAKKNHSSALNNHTIFAKDNFDSSLSASVFNWNNATFKNIPINKAQRLDTQYLSGLDNYFTKAAHLHGANKKSISDAHRAQLHDTGRGGLIAQYQQRVDGIEVFSRTINVLVNRKNQYVASSGYFASDSVKPALDYLIDEKDALGIGYRQNTGEDIYQLSLNTSKSTPQYKKVNGHSFSKNYRLNDNSRIKKVYYPKTSDLLTPAYYVEIETSEIDSNVSIFYSYVIDGLSGEVLFKNNLTSDVATTYNVFAGIADNFPFDGPQGNDLTPHPTGDINDTPNVGDTLVTPNIITLDFGPISTADPWLGVADTTTRGNNVDAYADISGADGFDDQDVRPEMTGANAFEYNFGAFKEGVIGDGQKFAVVNLFYVNNFLHDWFYDNGFDEQAGNAQQSNYGRGGSEGDRMLVEAQDFSGTNNANMSTPSDGGTPRMQMFIWNTLNTAAINIDGINNINAGSGAFGPTEFDVTGIMSLVNDATNPIGDGCETITTVLTTQIAIIDRGSCNFTVKVKNAQNAGAIGAIIANNVAAGVDGGGVINMGGTDDTISIPSLLISLEKANEIKTALTNDPSLQANLVNQGKPLDSSLDNGIVVHEWAHYLSGRLVGNANGLSNNQGRSMGEGWSDFVALLFMTEESDNLLAGNDIFQGVYSASTFVGDAYNGIRRAPYSTDMNKNAMTFKHIEDGVPLPINHPIAFGSSGANNSEVHASGEIWAVVLWDVFVGLINKPGYSFDQAREVMKDYLVAGMKMTPNSPTMLEARDAILAAAIATDSEDFIIIRDAFTRRGMGASAVAPIRESIDHSGVIEDFTEGVDVPASIIVDANSIDMGSCDQDGVLDPTESATINMTFKNYSSGSLPAFDVNLSSTADLSFSDSMVTVDALPAFGDTVNKSFQVTLNSASFMQNLDIVATVDEIGVMPDDFIEPANLIVTISSNFDFNKSAHNDDMSSIDTSGFDWQVVTQADLLPFIIDDGAWHGPDSGSAGASDLITPEILVASVGDFSLTFDHYYLFESSEDDQGVIENWDGGVIEVSVDGAAWIDVIDFGASLSEPYNGTLDTFNTVLGGRAAYTATRDESSSAMQSNSLTFPDGLVNERQVRIRFRIGTDANTSEFGWLIDNLVVTNAALPMFSEIVAENNVCVTGNPPVISAGSDINIRVNDNSDISIDLSGVATDPDGDALTILWKQISGPAVVINNADALLANVMMAAPTADLSLVFELSVDDGSSTVTDTVNVGLNLNNAPTVTTSSSTVTEGQGASLVAVANDLDGDNVTYQWTQTGGLTVTLIGANTANTTFTAPQVDASTTLTFSVVVNDGFVNSAAATATVVVTNQQPQSTGGGGGGGSIPLPLLSLLYFISLVRRARFK